MTGPQQTLGLAKDLEPNAGIEIAAGWLTATPAQLRPRPLVPALRERFNLNLAEAAEVCALALAAQMRSGGGGDGE